jgi:hypothetical protein
METPLAHLLPPLLFGAGVVVLTVWMTLKGPPPPPWPQSE